MDLIATALPILLLITAYLARRRLGRIVGALREFNRANVELWEHYLRAQRPWEASWLHWVHTRQGERLQGDILPPCGDATQHRGQRPPGRPSR